MTQKARRKVTIRDIAEVVGVHHSTVSRALSPVMRDKISPEVVQKVERAAKKLGYYPNIAASALKHNRSFAIGVLIPDLMNPVFPPMIRGIQDTAETAGYTVITANTDDEDAKERSALMMMRGRSIEGVIVATARRDDPTVEECIQNDIPFVLVNRTVDREDVDAVVSDEDFGICSVLDHLLALRHKRIAHVAGPQDTSTGFLRARAFRNYLRMHGLPDGLVEHTNKFTIEEGRRAVRNLLSRDNSFTAVVASNDLLALGCMDALRDMGVLVPEDISVAGYDDILFLDRMTPALTTVAAPKYEMGAQATKTLLAILDGQKTSPVVLRMQPRLIVRNSTARAYRQT